MAQQYAVDAPPLTWLERLFPQRYVPYRANETRTHITLETRVYVDWLDRLRLLLSGWVVVRAKTYTDVVVNEAWTESEFSVLPPTSSAPPEAE